MEISRFTAIGIYHNESTKASSYEKESKFGGMISCIDTKDRPRLLITTEPIYTTAIEAKDVMQGIIDTIRNGEDPINIKTIETIIIREVEQLKEIGLSLRESAFKKAVPEKPVYSKTKEEAFNRTKDIDVKKELIESGLMKVLYYNDNYYTVVMTYDVFSEPNTYHLSMSLNSTGDVSKVDDETAKFFADNLLGEDCTEKPDESPFGTIRNFLGI